MKLFLLIALLLTSFGAITQNAGSGSMIIMFVGDVMGHGMQIKSAFDDKTGTYSYDSVFSRVAPVFKLADVVIANLEVTLAGEPYAGYPQFSSPDALADALKSSGVTTLVTANNHSVDRGKNGIIRTIDALNQRSIPFAGTYKNQENKDSTYPLLIERNGIRVALLNYTYGTNGIPIPAPTIVNLIDTIQIRNDLEKAKKLNVDEVIAFMHWGNEYQSSPNIEQLKLTSFMQNLGIRIVIGSHPHVLQRMECSFDTDSTVGRIAVYSLGNFVSNQRNRYRNGGAIAAIRIEKCKGGTRITHAGHILVWVHTPLKNGKRAFQVLPVSQYEQIPDYFSIDDEQLVTEFASDSRKLFGKENFNTPEIHFRDGRWLLPWSSIDEEKFPPERLRRIVPWRKKRPNVHIPFQAISVR